jgi:hypothetical protein
VVVLVLAIAEVNHLVFLAQTLLAFGTRCIELLDPGLAVISGIIRR